MNHPDPSRPFAPTRLDRRRFLRATAAGCLGVSLPWRQATADDLPPVADASFDELSRDLLRDWCDGMLAVQIDAPSDPAKHGALGCPSCDFIHGRCMDAVYPFLHMAKVTGEEKYLEAGIAVLEWSKNVSLDDGSWTVIADPKSWRGITIFGAIALAEALHHHGDLLDAATRARWQERLGRAADYVYRTFTRLGFSNINYGCTGIYGMHLLGRVLDRPAYFERSRQLAAGLDDFISRPNGLLIGEGNPVNGTSPRGCRPVDLGYNVEESIVALALCAEATGDPGLTATTRRLLESHLEFMLPDGAWDNSWGTRQAKWTYWGSRTSDGCQPGYALLAAHHPAFATAVIENTRLMRRCTARGLLHGGPHYINAGVPPCVHHTFTHAKALAALRDHDGLARRIQPGPPLPRAVADGIRDYPEIATSLAARGPWRATVTATDWIYRERVRQPTGGALALLWHQQVGPLFAGSMTRYERVEKNNMQINPHRGDFHRRPARMPPAGRPGMTMLLDSTRSGSGGSRSGYYEYRSSAGHFPLQGKFNAASARVSKDLPAGVAATTATAMALETTLILFKPDAIEKQLTGKVLARFEEAGFVVRGIKMMKLDDVLLREHYAHIADKPFFPEIVIFMSKTPVIALALEGEDVISKVRDLLGPTDSKAAAPGTIRGDFGEDKMVNVCHASDSPEAAAAEMKRFFKDGEVFAS